MFNDDRNEWVDNELKDLFLGSTSKVAKAGYAVNHQAQTLRLFLACTKSMTKETKIARLTFALLCLLIYGCSSRAPVDPNDALILAARSGDLGEIDRLIKSGVDPNFQRPMSLFSPLHEAAKTDKSDAIEELVKLGANVNIRGANGFTPLHEAALDNSINSARKLVQLGADKNARTDSGALPCDIAKIGGNQELIAFLAP